jgi:quinol monooxygenase YgiN
MSHVIIATWTARPGSEATIAGILRDLTEASRREPGCRFYQAQESLETPGVFVVYEIYDDVTSAEEHTRSDHFRKYVVERAAALLQSRERRTFETLGTSDGADG